MHLIINSNTCVGWNIYNEIKKEYTSPLIGTLIPNDEEYIEFIKNFKTMINSSINVTSNPKNDTIFEKQSGSKYYSHNAIQVPYPIIKIEDIDIHCIHENDNMECLKTFKRRCERANKIIKTNNYKILNILVFTELITETNDYQQTINAFLTNKDIDTVNIFLGPKKYKINTDNMRNVYIEDIYFDNIHLKRNTSFIMICNNQPISTNILIKHIRNNLI